MNYKLNLQLKKEDHEYMKNFALKNYKKSFISNGVGRYFYKLSKREEQRDFALTICNEKMHEIGIKNWKEEPLDGTFIGVNQENAFVHKHKDKAEETKCHLRLNFMIQKPTGGGMPIVDGKQIDVEEGECWINLASLWEHSSTPVVGIKERIVLSIGTLVSLNDSFINNFLVNSKK